MFGDDEFAKVNGWTPFGIEIARLSFVGIADIVTSREEAEQMIKDRESIEDSKVVPKLELEYVKAG